MVSNRAACTSVANTDTCTMPALAVWLSTLLAIPIVNSAGSSNNEAPMDKIEVSLLQVGVPESETQLGPHPAADGYNSRHLRAIYRWPDKWFCHYKFKVEAVTTVEVGGGRKTSRHFLIVTLDHRPFDVLELGDSDSFFTDGVKLGRFILSQTIRSCDRLVLEYRMAGDGCRARDYRRVKTFTPEVEDEQKVIVEDWRWEAADDECDNHQVIML